MDEPLVTTISDLEATPPSPRVPRIWLVGASVATAGILLLILIRSLWPARAPEVPIIAPSPTPSPTPIRELSAIATQSAFIFLETRLASVSAAITATNLDDPSLSPPIIDLPLGFVE